MTNTRVGGSDLPGSGGQAPEYAYYSRRRSMGSRANRSIAPPSTPLAGESSAKNPEGLRPGDIKSFSKHVIWVTDFYYHSVHKNHTKLDPRVA